MFFEIRIMGGHLEVFKNTLLGMTFSGFTGQATGEYNWRFSRTGYWGGHLEFFGGVYSAGHLEIFEDILRGGHLEFHEDRLLGRSFETFP